jgi:hypothetical protein
LQPITHYEKDGGGDKNIEVVAGPVVACSGVTQQSKMKMLVPGLRIGKWRGRRRRRRRITRL